jgi:hypothetical protein
MLSWLTALAAAAAIAPPEPACTAATATPVDVQAIGRNPESYVGRCVSVAGISMHNAIYDGIEGYYLSQRRGRRGYYPARNLGHRLGLYWDEDLPKDFEQFRRLTVTGRVDTCERKARALKAKEDKLTRERAAAGDGDILILMLGGYCHYTGGPVIHVEAVEAGPAEPLYRLAGHRAASRFGSLIAAPDDWPPLASVKRRAAQIREAIVTGDRDGLSRLFGKFGAAGDELSYLLDDPSSPFREIRGSASPVQTAILVERFDLAGKEPASRKSRDSVVCFCRGKDCNHAWPIAAPDARNGPDLPFACLELFEDATFELFVNAPIDKAPLHERISFAAPPEPAPAALRRE